MQIIKIGIKFHNNSDEISKKKKINEINFY